MRLTVLTLAGWVALVIAGASVRGQIPHQLPTPTPRGAPPPGGKSTGGTGSTGTLRPNPDTGGNRLGVGEGDGPLISLTCIGLDVPAAVHVAAVVPRDEAGGNPVGHPIDDRYEWDFGDPDGRWNRLPGWNAAHVYDKPGQYNVTLTVTGPGGKATRRTTWVRVAPDQRRRVYVSAAGNDQATGANPALAVRTAARAFQLAAAGDAAAVLFRRGDVFEIGPTIGINGRGLRVGNYDAAPVDPSQRVPRVGPVPDAAPLPVLMKVEAPAKQTSMFFVGKGARDILFEGIEFDSQWRIETEGPKKIPARAFTVGATNFAVRYCTFRNLTDAVNTEVKPVGVLIQDNTFTPEIRGYCYWGNGTDAAVVGNVMTHSHQEHHIRCSEPGVTRLLVAYNDLSRPNTSKGGIELRQADWFYVADNHLDHGTMRVGPQDVGIDKNQEPNWASVKCTWGVVQDNRLDNCWVHVRLGSEHVMVRNNTVRLDDGEWAYTIPCVMPGFDDVRKIRDVTLEHNTAINNGTKGRFLWIQGRPEGLTVRNNLYVAPHLRSAGGKGWSVDATDPAFAAGVTFDGNVYPSGPGGVHHAGQADVPRGTWAGMGRMTNERYQDVPWDPLESTCRHASLSIL